MAPRAARCSSTTASPRRRARLAPLASSSARRSSAVACQASTRSCADPSPAIAHHVGELPASHLGPIEGQRDPGQERAHVQGLDRPALHLQEAGDPAGAGQHAAGRAARRRLRSRGSRPAWPRSRPPPPTARVAPSAARAAAASASARAPVEVALREPGPGQEQPRLGVVRGIGVTEHDQGPLGRLDGVASEPDGEEHLAAIRGEGGHEPRRVALAWRRPPRPGRRPRGRRARRPADRGRSRGCGPPWRPGPRGRAPWPAAPTRARSVEGGLEVALVRAQRPSVEEQASDVGVVVVAAQTGERAPVGREGRVELAGALEHERPEEIDLPASRRGREIAGLGDLALGGRRVARG